MSSIELVWKDHQLKVLMPVIHLWFKDRVCGLNAGPHNYKRKNNSERVGAVDLDSLTMPDLEDREEEFDFFTFP